MTYKIIDTCKWTYHEGESYYSACKNSFGPTAEDHPLQSGFDYCPFCGREVDKKIINDPNGD